MSTEALSHIWNVQGVNPTQKLILIWIANASGQLGSPVCPEWHGMGEFACYPWEDGPRHLRDLESLGLVVWPERSDVYLAYDGEYFPEVDYDAEPKKLRRRVAALIERDGSHCRYCRKTFPAYHVDHVIPKSRGGPDTMDNLVLACPACNMAKGARTPEEWGGPK